MAKSFRNSMSGLVLENVPALNIKVSNNLLPASARVEPAENLRKCSEPHARVR